ncbi:MAG: AzlD domain-containing protein [Oscillospiraceae bacterium]|nr:AzlD domain-containing protein [Oscillospiraceae bacterium]
MNTVVLIAVMALTTYLVRALPLALFRKKVENRFVKGLLYYLPYAILAAMTVPAMFFAAGSVKVGAAAFAAAFAAALAGKSLIAVALAACAGAAAALLI